MLVLSVGLPKSGSALFYNLINDMLEQGGGTCARTVRQQHGMQTLMAHHNNNIGKPTLSKLFRLWWASRRVGAFAVKTHAAPPTHPLARLLYGSHMIRVLYSYRDPRDVVLSALDHGRRIRESGKDHTFAALHDLNAAVDAVRGWTASWSACRNIPQALLLRYEDLLARPVETMGEIADQLELDLTEQQLAAIYNRYSIDNPEREERGTHLNKAQTQRWKAELDDDSQRYMNKRLDAMIRAMGYTPG